MIQNFIGRHCYARWALRHLYDAIATLAPISLEMVSNDVAYVLYNIGLRSINNNHTLYH
ncbi:MAG: hypothetical protein IPJ74_24665 [Saprospiraceae bacterium]|nr:hypothetical protein [Saprospiraceae bacterium]